MYQQPSLQVEFEISNTSGKTILIVGRRGRGKSSLSNLIRTGKHWQQDFLISHGPSSVTRGPLNLPSVINSLKIIDTTGIDNDEVTSRLVAINEIQGIIASKDTIDGVLFVMRTGRCDQWDILVYTLYIQFILSEVPNSMIGVVFTNAPHSVVKENSWEFYLSKNNDIEKEFELFFSELLTRCEKKVCFIDNPSPEEDLEDLDFIRELSLQNVLKLITSLSSSFSFGNILQTIYHWWLLWSDQIRENRFGLGITACALLISIIGFLAKKFFLVTRTIINNV